MCTHIYIERDIDIYVYIIHVYICIDISLYTYTVLRKSNYPPYFSQLAVREPLFSKIEICMPNIYFWCQLWVHVSDPPPLSV